jgi:sugar-specific transcriptional regulator TrmB
MIFRKYGNLEFNEDLISGFLTALKDFSAEVTGGRGAMKNLDMGDTNIMLINEKGILAAAALNKRDDENIAYKALKEMLEEFIAAFKDELVDWKGNLKIFKDYEQKIDKKLKNGKIAEKELYAPMLKKKLPKQLIEMGALTKDEFAFANCINGQDTPETIAEKAGIPLQKVEVMLDKLKGLGLIKHNKL